MSWHPNDLVADADLTAYEATILTQFGQSDWQAKRQKALEDWIFPMLANAGLEPHRLRTRFQPAAVYGFTSSAFTDYTAAAQNDSPDDIPLASVLATSADFLYVGAPWPFRGLSVRLLDAVSSASRTLTVALWRDAWQTVSATDGTAITSGKPFSGGGAITWTVPGDWVVRPVNDSEPYYWARVSLDGAPTGAAVKQISGIRRSVLCAPAALRTLFYIFREARIQQDGPWAEKAEQYEAEAQAAWDRALPLVGREFDTDTVDDTVDADEATQTTDDASQGGGWSLERA